ncbi:protein-O-fucosyltransferase 2 [Trifolium pratense]|uniref:Protein-O-fucosyltransferase 2 n=1 Tax=Trifolium pratense TaxID=57577 RepID=A0A2K3LYX9_TRIPR|nr:protein-O-fucosyltransferase 2 [Trifolium pratense]
MLVMFIMNIFTLKVEVMLDKTICAMSSVFIGAPGSTFTEDILRLRKGWGSASVCDEYLCQGEEPNIVAENECKIKDNDGFLV